MSHGLVFKGYGTFARGEKLVEGIMARIQRAK